MSARLENQNSEAVAAAVAARSTSAGNVLTDNRRYKYYLIYYYGEHQRVGGEFINRDTPLDNEDALLEEHARLEKTFGSPVVLDDWKRLD